jgi:hypothetical protein
VGLPAAVESQLLADFVAKVQNCLALILSSETKVTAVADKYSAKLIYEVASEFVTGE